MKGERAMRANGSRRKDELLLSSLLSNRTIREAARSCGLSETQVYARLNDAEFKARYDAARHGVLDQSAAALQIMLQDAVNTLHGIVLDADAPPQTRLNAADAIIRNSLKLTEQNEIMRRLDALEKRYENIKQA